MTTKAEERKICAKLRDQKAHAMMTYNQCSAQKSPDACETEKQQKDSIDLNFHQFCNQRIPFAKGEKVLYRGHLLTVDQLPQDGNVVKLVDDNDGITWIDYKQLKKATLNPPPLTTPPPPPLRPE